MLGVGCVMCRADLVRRRISSAVIKRSFDIAARTQIVHIALSSPALMDDRMASCRIRDGGGASTVMAGLFG
jgi:hypothetical protein